MIEKDLKELRVELQDLKERLQGCEETTMEDDIALGWAVTLLDELISKEKTVKQARCVVCHDLGNVVNVTARITRIKKDVCKSCYLKLKETGLIE